MNNDSEEKIVHAAPVPPFVRFVASAVPMVFDNSLSYYEALCALWKWLQDDVIDVINNNASVTELWRQELTTFENDLTDKFNDLNDAFDQLHEYVDTYFENLDVQEEINNKLDQMVEDGVLQEIITTYIQANVAWTFDTVADMKLATNLVAGSFARTLGFHTLNDGGGALYKITNSGTANEMDIIAVGSLFANLIKPSVVTPEMYGAYGDGTHDDTTCIQECFDNNDYVQMSKEYLISSQLSFNGSIDGCGSGVIKSDPSARITNSFILSTSHLEVKGMNFNCASNVEFTLDDKSLNYNLAIIASGKVVIENCEFHNLYEKFVRIIASSTYFVDIHDNLFSSDNKTNVYMSVCIEFMNVINSECVINIHDNTFKGYEYEYVDQYDNDTNVNAAALFLAQVNVQEINVDSNVFEHLGRYGTVAGNVGLSRICAIDCYFNVKPFHFTNNKLTNCHWTAIRLHGTDGALIDNNLITAARTCSEPLILISDTYNSTGEAPVGCDNVTISNNKIYNKDKIFEFGIFINSHATATLAGTDGFYGHVDNLNIINNDIDFCCKKFFVFDYSLKKCNITDNHANSDFSGVTSMPAHTFINVDERGVMKTATTGKDFSNTFINIFSNNIKLDGAIVQNRTTDATLVTIFDDLTVNVDDNRLENTSTGYVTYATQDQPFNLTNNIIKGNMGGIFNANKAYDNVVFYSTGSAGVYNATVNQNNHEYLN